MRAENQLSIKHCVDSAFTKLSSSESESDTATARLEAEILLAFILDKSRSYLYTWPDHSLEKKQVDQFNTLVQRRYSGEPVAYITGIREFWGLPLKVSPAVLIPRPETEHLVEIALRHIPENEQLHVADLGTGSGAIALAIASERNRVSIEATDISEAALEIARTNQANLRLGNVNFLQGRWFEPLTNTKFDLVVSNPPYVADQDPHLQQGDLRFEPAQALSSGSDGLDDIRTIIDSARAHLSEGGCLLLEHGYDQANAVMDLFEKLGYSDVQCFRDYGERERATIGRWLT